MKACSCSTATGSGGRRRKSFWHDRSHKPWSETNRRAQCEEIRIAQSELHRDYHRAPEKDHGLSGFFTVYSPT